MTAEKGEEMEGSGRCKVIRAQETYEGKQGLSFLSGITAESAGAKAICMHLVTIPPGERGKAHLHEHHETAMYVLRGSVVTWTGEGLTDRAVIEPGDFMYIPAGEPHLPINESETEPCTVVLARTDPREQQSVVLRPDLDEINQKIEIRFKRFDTNGNGVLTQDDYVGVAQRLLDAYGVSAEEAKGQAVTDGYRGLWDTHARDMDTDRDGEISREEFHIAIARNIVGRNGVEETVVPLMRAVLDLCDEDGSATLDKTEFARLMGVFGVPEADSAETFDKLDRDGSGSISFDEFVEAGKEFYTSDDPDAAGNTLFGRYAATTGEWKTL